MDDYYVLILFIGVGAFYYALIHFVLWWNR